MNRFAYSYWGMKSCYMLLAIRKVHALEADNFIVFKCTHKKSPYYPQKYRFLLHNVVDSAILSISITRGLAYKNGYSQERWDSRMDNNKNLQSGCAMFEFIHFQGTILTFGYWPSSHGPSFEYLILDESEKSVPTTSKISYHVEFTNFFLISFRIVFTHN